MEQFTVLEKVYKLDCNEFEELVRKYLNQDTYNVIAENEYSNYEHHLFHVKPFNGYELDYYNKFTKPDIESFIITGKFKKYHTVGAGSLLEYLADELLAIPFGYYILEINW